MPLGKCPELIKKAMFMEGHVPKGGTCISSFLILKRKTGILLGKMARSEIWTERFLVGEMFAPKYVSSNKWVIPASHLKYGEKPEEAAMRVLVEQVGSKGGKLKLLQVQSHLSQDPNDPDAAHWDICFVFGGTLKGKIQRPEWFSEIEFIKPKELKSDDFTRGHGDVLKELGMIRA
jgi:ADP-ribose pyrophosphatase YjhB (NUDIX family)